MWDMLLGMGVIAAVLTFFIYASSGGRKKTAAAQDDPMPGHNVGADVHEHNSGQHS